MISTRPRACALLFAASLALLAGPAAADPPWGHGRLNVKPAFLSGDVRAVEYDGVNDDLLTAGLGSAGLASPIAPGYANPLAPTAAELRRNAIWNNYRALVDTTAAGGYGVFFGPNVIAEGVPGSGDGKVAGAEYLAISDDGSGRNVTLMVQVPAQFDPGKPCVVAATSSGSRGVYGAISTGEWGLKKGCAVAYSDKGTGASPHDLMADTVALIDGTRQAAAVAGRTAHFRAEVSDAERNAFNALTPHRFAFKHAHSQRNPEKEWGRSTLQAIEFAFYVLNERYGPRTRGGHTRALILKHNTRVIASSISNGGGAALAAAEQDWLGLIDGVAVTEPAVQLPQVPGLIRIERGGVPVAAAGRPLYDYMTWANLYQPCAGLAPELAGTPFQASYAALFGLVAANRCASLKTKGWLTGETTAAQASEALARLRAYGWEADSDALHASSAALEIPSAVSVTFANAYTRSSVIESLCGYSYAAVVGSGPLINLPTTLAPAALEGMFATGNGVPPTAGVALINDRSPAAFGGPRRDVASVSPSTGVFDMNVDGALCLRDLFGDGDDANARALRQGVREASRSGWLHGKPTLIVQGRADALLPVNHSGRAYTALNKAVERGRSRLSYLEVTNAQHFDGFIGLPTVLPGYDSRYVPLHLYLFRALDAMWAHLVHGAALPASQVVRAVPRGGSPGSAPALTAANVPAFAIVPAPADAIRYGRGVLKVPD
jgi:hydroxybutyrate-dimer hydrolase